MSLGCEENAQSVGKHYKKGKVDQAFDDYRDSGTYYGVISDIWACSGCGYIVVFPLTSFYSSLLANLLIRHIYKTGKEISLTLSSIRVHSCH